MRRQWFQPTPLDMVCPVCRGTIARGSWVHDCNQKEADDRARAARAAELKRRQGMVQRHAHERFLRAQGLGR
jgi:hypothetical protein